MIKIENFEVLGLKHTIRGMRNPKNSWAKSDSVFADSDSFDSFIGKNDHKLMIRLARGGAVHAKYRRMITVYLDITAPLYWWKEFDTYKVGTVSNSCSTMHKIHAKEFVLDDFSHEHLVSSSIYILEETIKRLNWWRSCFLERQANPQTEILTSMTAKDCWWQMIQLLPSSYNQKRTIMLNYEVLHNIYESRKNHKLDEWRDFCSWIETLPYSEVITLGQNTEKES